MNIGKRVEDLEKKLGVNQTPESLNEMIEKFQRGDYAREGFSSSPMALVVEASEAMKRGTLNNFFAELREFLPDLLAEFIKESICHAFKIKAELI